MAFLVLFVCAVACYTDLRYRIIPNRLTFPVMLSAPLVWAAVAGWRGAAASLAGMALGMLLLIVPTLLGGMGGGDLKMLMALGAVGGPAYIISVFVYMCLAGGLSSVAILAYKRKLLTTLKSVLVSAWWLLFSRGRIRLPVAPTGLTMPYALCITAGAVAAILYPIY